MRLLSAGFIRHYEGRILNIHPSLLPLFPGLHTHQRAIDAGMKEAGCTVHVVTETLDDGPILAQARVPVLAGDSADGLAARVLEAEHALYPQAVAAYDKTVATYRQTVLTAFQEVEDNLAALRVLGEEDGLQRQAATFASESLRLTNNQYQAGTVSYLNVVTAQAASLSAERSLIDISGRRLVASAALIKALGGDWTP